jgi:hypothetical protein
MNIDAREEAVSDCLYAKSLGEVALKQHIENWINDTPKILSDVEYALTIKEISDKLSTPECLLEN